MPPPRLPGADSGGQQVLRHPPAAAQGNCAERGEQRLHQPVAADQQTVSAAASPVCPVRQTGTGGRPHRPSQRQGAAVLGREQLAGIVQGLSRQENRRGGQPPDLRVLGKLHKAIKQALCVVSLGGRGYQNLSKAGYEKTGAQLRARVRKMKRGGYPAENGRR